MNAVASIPEVYVNAGRNFGLRHAQLVYRVLYPAVMPQLIIGLRITLGIAWLVVVAAEMIAVNSGLGFLIVDARNAGQPLRPRGRRNGPDRRHRAAARYRHAIARTNSVDPLGILG